ncbi:hypothetical protein [Flavisolibacter tropicus]|uniref:Uncharacterized protein n=1 Tax=Flavisolibacter tropicus TaxID=1492898 RepID=A0A172TXP1_9BACT|nr:hypothetical protein [Flavisolibacter tropicus]ANE51752.1 hypothetical protein SY85_15865 [Flavisolibacter tropicus]
MMKRFTILACSTLFFTTAIYAQKTPWAGLPASKKVQTIMGEEKKVYLTFDTLVQEKKPIERNETFYYEKKTWYSAPADKIGYGYATADGKPFGIWRYFTITGGKYELFCEGSFQNLEANNLVVDEELTRKYTSMDKEATKASFMNGLEQKAFFTGEWRFYKNGKLDYISVFDKKVKLPLDEASIMNDPSGTVSTQLFIAVPEKIHLAGQLIYVIHFSTEGLVTNVYANGVNLAFSKDGKPVIDPLVELPLID